MVQRTFGLWSFLDSLLDQLSVSVDDKDAEKTLAEAEQARGVTFLGWVDRRPPPPDPGALPEGARTSTIPDRLSGRFGGRRSRPSGGGGRFATARDHHLRGRFFFFRAGAGT